ncbi:MAG: glutaredoxin family protein [Flavobacterium sp.]|nr:glutaredoxin family protein [Flavobacterium sp.]
MKKFFFALLLIVSIATIAFSQDIQKKPSDKSVMIIYGSDECHHCTDTKAFLKENKIEFVFYDIDKNPEALKEMLGKLRNAGISTSNLGIPVVDKQGIIFTNNGIFEEFLKKLK